MVDHETPAGDEEALLPHIVAGAVGEALDHRFRAMVLTSAVVAALVAVAIALPTTILQNRATDRAAVDRARHNCRLVTDIADVLGTGDRLGLRRGGFLSTDARLRRSEVLDARRIALLHPGPLKRVLNDPETLRLERASRRLDLRTTSYWLRVLIPRLRTVARADCSGR